MPPPNKRQKHTITLNTRRSIETLVSESFEDYSYEQEKQEEVDKKRLFHLNLMIKLIKLTLKMIQ